MDKLGIIQKIAVGYEFIQKSFVNSVTILIIERLYRQVSIQSDFPRMLAYDWRYINTIVQPEYPQMPYFGIKKA